MINEYSYSPEYHNILEPILLLQIIILSFVTSGAIMQVRNVAFNPRETIMIIEGIDMISKLNPGLYDVEAAPDFIQVLKLCNLLGIQVFDVFGSLEAFLLSRLTSAGISNEDLHKLKILTIQILLSAYQYNPQSYATCYKKIILPFYLEMVNLTQKEMPNWIREVETFKNLQQYLSTNSNIKNDLKCSHFLTAIKNSNELTVEHLINYLKEHPQVKNIYGLVSILHVDLFQDYQFKTVTKNPKLIDKIKKTSEFSLYSRIKKYDESNLTLTIDNRKINVFLFGRMSGSNKAYHHLKKKLMQDGLLPHQSFHEKIQGKSSFFNLAPPKKNCLKSPTTQHTFMPISLI